MSFNFLANFYNLPLKRNNRFRYWMKDTNNYKIFTIKSLYCDSFLKCIDSHGNEYKIHPLDPKVQYIDDRVNKFDCETEKSYEWCNHNKFVRRRRKIGARVLIKNNLQTKKTNKICFDEESNNI